MFELRDRKLYYYYMNGSIDNVSVLLIHVHVHVRPLGYM